MSSNTDYHTQSGLTSATARIAYNTDYSIATGNYDYSLASSNYSQNTTSGYGGYWWPRSASAYCGNDARHVYGSGYVGSYYSGHSLGARPALRINLASFNLANFVSEISGTNNTSLKVDIGTNIISRTAFTQIADKTISNTVTETTLFGTGVGSLIIPANLLVVGRTYNIKFRGYMSGVNGNNATLKLKLGNVTLVTSTNTMPATFTNAYFENDFTFTCRSIGETGTIIGNGRTIINAGIESSTSYTRTLQMTSVATINTTIANAINSTYTWATASENNTITVTNASIEVLN
ncbi:MAG: hypothetical protein EOM05_12565 [Clostridia bacterium]|nr:hypothetical protein [Clostridia bacterium]